jgi:hypothetical protein
MPNQKRTIKRDSVFRGSAPTESPIQGIPKEESPVRQTAIWLSDEELDWLDTHIQRIKKGGWRSVTRSALLRSLIRAAMEEPIDLSGVSGDVELTQRLTAARK